MNDELNNQLASQWSIPAYARGLLWLETASETVRAEGERGLFTLTTPADLLTLRWGGAEGPALVQLRWHADSLDWDGAVRIGGFVDALHLTELDGLPDTLSILQVGGQPLKSGYAPYPALSERKRVPFAVPAFHDGVAGDADEGITTWVAFTDSPVMVLAQDALVSKLPVYCFGSLAGEDAGWHENFALPVVLEAMTIFPP